MGAFHILLGLSLDGASCLQSYVTAFCKPGETRGFAAQLSVGLDGPVCGVYPLPVCLVGCSPSAFTPRRAAHASAVAVSPSFPDFPSPETCFFRNTPPNTDFSQKSADVFCLLLALFVSDFYLFSSD